MLRCSRYSSSAMAASWTFTQHPRFCIIITLFTVFLLLLVSREFRPRQQQRHKRDILESTELPAEHIDPAAIDLTPLVNTLINSSQSGSRQLFSLLSVTSYSSLALHKLTLLVYNISSIRSIESNKFRRRFCYCVTNETNDLTDFTAILLDVMGNSTSYLHELFKSASILSVSQRNNSDCIYICVMAGKMGREVPELWQVDSITPLFNQTVVEGPHRVANVSSFRLPVEWHQLPTNVSHSSPSGMSSMLTSRVHSTAHASPTTPDEVAPTPEKVVAVQPLATPRQPATFEPQSLTTVERSETTKAATTVELSAQRATTSTVATSQTEATEISEQSATTVSIMTDAALTTVPAPSTTPTPLPTTATQQPTTSTTQATAPTLRPSTAGLQPITETSQSVTVPLGQTTPTPQPTAITLQPTTPTPKSTTPTLQPTTETQRPTTARLQPIAATSRSVTIPLGQTTPTPRPTTPTPRPTTPTPRQTTPTPRLTTPSPRQTTPTPRPTTPTPRQTTPTPRPTTPTPRQTTPTPRPTTPTPRLTTPTPRPTTPTPRQTTPTPRLTTTSVPPRVTSSIRQTTATSTTTHHTTSTIRPTGTSPTWPTVAPTVARRTTGPLAKRTTTSGKLMETEKAGCPWRRPEPSVESESESEWEGSITVSATKLQPCVLELCKFFSTCLCRPFSHKTRMKRYCDDSHLWYEKHTLEVCRRVRRVSFSRNLKQRCLTKMCNKL